MRDQEITEVVRKAIDLAMKKQGWSRAQLGRRVGVSAATIHRWYSNSVQRYHIGKLVKVFELAGLSFDEQLGVGGARTAEPIAVNQIVQLKDEVLQLRSELGEIKEQLTALMPAANLLQALLIDAPWLIRTSISRRIRIISSGLYGFFGVFHCSRVVLNVSRH